jgi:hypothetical protein
MDEEIAESVRKHGWDAISISDHKPPFLYSVGLMESQKHPELIMFGLEASNTHALFSKMIWDMGEGRRFTEPGVETIRIGEDEHRVGLRRVHPTQHQVYLGFAMGFCRLVGRIGELEAMQVFWPDRSGKFPFDVGCELGVFELQPRIDLELTPREIKRFERKWGS